MGYVSWLSLQQQHLHTRLVVLFLSSWGWRRRRRSLPRRFLRELMNRFRSLLGVFYVLELQVETVSRFITNAHKLFQFAASRWMLPELNLAQNSSWKCTLFCMWEIEFFGWRKIMHHNKPVCPKQLKKICEWIHSSQVLGAFDFMNVQRRTLPHPCQKKKNPWAFLLLNPNTSCQLIRGGKENTSYSRHKPSTQHKKAANHHQIQNSTRIIFIFQRFTITKKNLNILALTKKPCCVVGLYTSQRSKMGIKLEARGCREDTNERSAQIWKQPNEPGKEHCLAI